ncbi:MAG: hypothetical protein NTX25_03560 [Proteobacteria bacterium]|nr:hypothetical protein [Pseudomonadota bacterium]
MISRITEKYTYKHVLGTIVTEAEVGVSEKGRRSLAISEIERLGKLVALDFLRKNYRRSIEDSSFSLNAQEVRAIMALLKIEKLENFGKLIGCQKSKVSKILNGEQSISKAHAQLVMERLASELAIPGSVRRLLGEPGPQIMIDERMQAEVNQVRYGT